MKITVHESKKNESRMIQSWFEFKSVPDESDLIPQIEDRLREKFKSARVEVERDDQDYVVAVVGRRLAPADVRWALAELQCDDLAINTLAYI